MGVSGGGGGGLWAFSFEFRLPKRNERKNAEGRRNIIGINLIATGPRRLGIKTARRIRKSKTRMIIISVSSLIIIQ